MSHTAAHMLSEAFDVVDLPAFKAWLDDVNDRASTVMDPIEFELVQTPHHPTRIILFGSDVPTTLDHPTEPDKDTPFNFFVELAKHLKPGATVTLSENWVEHNAHHNARSMGSATTTVNSDGQILAQVVLPHAVFQSAAEHTVALLNLYGGTADGTTPLALLHAKAAVLRHQLDKLTQEIAQQTAEANLTAVAV